MGPLIITEDPRLILAGTKVGHRGVPRDLPKIVTMGVLEDLQVTTEVSQVVKVMGDHRVTTHGENIVTMVVIGGLQVTSECRVVIGTTCIEDHKVGALVHTGIMITVLAAATLTPRDIGQVVVITNMVVRTGRLLAQGSMGAVVTTMLTKVQ